MVLLWSAVPLAGQAVEGEVRDGDSGAPAPGVRLLLVDGSGQVAAESRTDEEGRFRIDVDAPGPYTLRPDAAGLMISPQGPFHLQTDQVLDLSLTVTAIHDRSAGPALSGVVIDRIAEMPLEGATVILSGTDAHAVTDEEGRFAIDVLDPGVYYVGFLHPRLLELGLDPEPAVVEVPVEGGSTVTLSTPSLEMILGTACRAAGEPVGAAVAGSVWTGGGEVLVPGARVTATWDGGRVDTETDTSGSFLLCGVPSDARVTLTASFLGAFGAPETLDLAGAPAVIRDLDLTLPTVAGEEGFPGVGLEEPVDGPAEVRGVVLDHSGGLPVAEAVVTFEGTGLEAVTGLDGTFAFRDVDPGTYRLRIHHPRYGSRSQFVEIVGEAEVDLHIELPTDVIPLRELVVTATSRPPQAEIARRSGTRRDVFAGEELARAEERGGRVLDFLRQTAGGIQVLEGTYGDNTPPPGTVCVELRRSLRGIITGGACNPPLLVIDGVRVSGGMEVMGEVLMGLVVADFESIEVLGPLQAGILYGTSGSNGAIALHSRGRGPYQSAERDGAPR